MQSITTQDTSVSLNSSAISPIDKMSSVEISELTGKRHDNVMRVAKRLFDKGIILSPQIEEVFINGKGGKQSRKVYQLDKTESLNLVANLSPEFTAKIISRWQELESKVTLSLPNFNDPATAARAWADKVEQNQALTHQLEELKPAAKAFDRIAKAEGSHLITDTAKALQIQPKKLVNWLSSNRWIYKRSGSKSWTGYQNRIQANLIEHKETIVLRRDGTEKLVTQVRITPKGMTSISKSLEVAA